MGFVMLILTGLLVGVVAKFLMPGDDPGGMIVTTLLGIAGASVGGFVANAVGIGVMGSVGSFASAVGGAMLLLLGYRVFLGRKSG
ncbi:MAG: GlsB/YeaQ/YmgE family stress response membrane protein [Myxococcales bacterium]|nr:GlsB/YeaQ/YmgE family stress response membrane protein [Myxococcales bacterium]